MMNKDTQQLSDHRLQRFASMMARAHPHLLAHSLATARLVYQAIPFLPWGGYASSAILLAGAFLHDVGKTTWPEELFTKRVLDLDDKAVIKAHPVVGASMVREVWPNAPGQAVEIIATHHERPGGKGYPYGMEPDYPVLVMAACEVVDAMTHDRGYREALAVGAALAEIGKWAPEGVVEAVERVMRKAKVSSA